MRIFISYRRADSRSFTERISDRLAEVFGAENIFQDVDDIPAGLDFRVVLRDAVAECDAVLAIIGRQWVSIPDEAGNPRLHDPDDFVRIEVEAGLSLNKLVIPVIVDNASPPGAAILPESLRELAFRNAAFVRYNPDFTRDMQRLISRLQDYEQAREVALAEAKAREERERQAEEELRRQAAEAQARQAEEDRARKAREEQARMAREAQERQTAEEAQRQKEAQRGPEMPVDSPVPAAMPEVRAPARSRAFEIQPSPAAAPVERRLKGAAHRISWVIAIAVTVFALLPLLWMLIVSFQNQVDIFGGAIIPFVQFSPTLDSWSEALAEGIGAQSYVNSAIIAVTSTLISIVVGSITGYGLARVRYRFGNRRLLVWLISQRLLPPVITVMPMYIILQSFGLVNTLFGVIIATTTLVLPFAILIMRDYFADFPRDLEDSAQVDGANYLQILRSVALPNARPALLATALICFAFAWNEFLMPLVLLPDRSLMPYTTALLQAQQSFQQNPGATAAGVVMGVLLPVVLSLFVRRYIVAGLSLGTINQR